MNKAIFLLGMLILLFYRAIPAQIIINEFYADVALSITGDANGDGIRNAVEDEFIELVNPTDRDIDLKDYSIWVSGQLRHQFDTTTIISPLSAVVIFGGGTPIGTFGNSLVTTATSGALGLGNNGVKVELKNAMGSIIEEFTYPSENDHISWTRDPDIFGAFISHNQIPETYESSFSPGTMLNSFPFGLDNHTYAHFPHTTGKINEGDSLFMLPIYLIHPSNDTTVLTIHYVQTQDTDDLLDFSSSTISFAPNEEGQKFIPIPINNDLIVEGQESFDFLITEIKGGNKAQLSINQSFTLLIEDNDFDFPLLLNEIHADPALGLAGDANGDGVRDAREDEFLEFVNTSIASVDISGFQLFDNDILRHIIPIGTIIQAQQAFVIFGGGMLNGDYGNAITQTASSGSLNLLNTGDRIVLKDTTGATVYAYSYQLEGANNQSITRFPDLAKEDITTLHSTVGNFQLYSPGRDVYGNDFSELVATENHNLSSFKIYPNPTHQSITLDYPEDWKIERMELLNTIGQVINTLSIIDPIRIDVSSGVYFLKIYTKKGIFVEQLIVR